MSNATTLHELLALNRIIKLCRKLGYEVPVLNLAEIKRDNAIKPERKRIRFLSLEEETRLLEELHPDRVYRGMAQWRIRHPRCDKSNEMPTTS